MVESDREKLLAKIKFIEIALENNEHLDLLAEAKYSYEGEFNGFKVFLCDADETEYIFSKCEYIFGMLSWRKLESKTATIRSIGCEYCNCEADNLYEECKCKIPSKEELSKIFYERLIKEVEERISRIKNNLNIK